MPELTAFVSERETHTHIYIYIYNCVCVIVPSSSFAWSQLLQEGSHLQPRLVTQRRCGLLCSSARSTCRCYWLMSRAKSFWWVPVPVWKLLSGKWSHNGFAEVTSSRLRGVVSREITPKRSLRATQNLHFQGPCI